MQDLVGILPMLDAIVSHLDEGIMITDRAGGILFMNPALKKLLLGMGAHQNEQSTPSNIAQIRSVDLKTIMKEAFYEGIDPSAPLAQSGPLTPPEADGPARLCKFHRKINQGDMVRHLEIQCCLTCEAPSSKYGGHLRLFIVRDVTYERKTARFLERSLNDLITNDPKMIDILRRIDKVAPQNAAIILQGESGTGKTHIARLIHQLSNRSARPLIEVNCAAIPETLLESELFGHVKGAFTGAVSNRKGRFLAADGGTLFLDEVGEIPLHLQAKLLRALQDQSFEPVGADQSVKVDVRIISSSNRHLRDMVDAGDFRADLYYRLAVIPLHIPAIRERPGDIPLLLKHFCDDISARNMNGAGNVHCSSEAMHMLMDYPWPGNVRELENAVEHAVICARDGVVEPESLPFDVRSHCSHNNRISDRIMTVKVETEQQSNDIRNALNKARGNKSKAAEILGINRSTLWRRMRRLSIE